ncbi:hypothetical protein J1N35_024524 [Gossypium stocksii]|uniref:Uncharacterized protein n=1 Tax=Gossypium stocksii TaxID=47602 RepID=A0A9D3ZWT6_9ROSI|nr:hypothetical protein J1N35_024524 [Gossypium stocksii]
MAFKSLSKDFADFTVAYKSGNNQLALTQLIRELQSYELMLNDVRNDTSRLTEWKDYLAIKGKCTELLVIETCSVEDLVDHWVIGSRATNHACISLQEFKKTKDFRDNSY